MDQKFHAHIYFNDSQRPSAEAFYWLIQENFGHRVNLGKIYSNAVGPHLFPMFTVMFESIAKEAFTRFLQQNKGALSILIHEDTGNDFQDHTLGAEWLGNPLPLNFEHFERIKNEKSALVFPE